ncbi:MAG TPA: glycosyltransferase family 2 protein, partial [Pyrinomonadaceae bacterium]|nr:glycosyltransferase family 2 protein [Pyrinomonadaceae bacterium]
MLLYIFYFFAVISIYLGLLSLRGGVRFVGYLQKELAQELADYTPFVTVFVPCRGVDAGLKENVLSLFAQNYPAYEIIFVSDSENDPAFAVIEEARHSFKKQTGPVISTIVAGVASDSGQKVHNLRAALRAAHPAGEVLVFADTDARPQTFWLRALVGPLQDESIGATTGYRWFVAAKAGFASHLLSVWNAAIASALGKRGDKNFCWGGSTAIRRQTFAQLNIVERWRGTVSDDFTITRVLHEAGLPIKFVPHCLTPSFHRSKVGDLIEFTTRQLKITRAYASPLWKSVFIGSLIFVATVFGGIALVAVRAALGLSFLTPFVFLLLIFAMGAVKSHLRLRAVTLVIADEWMRTWPTTLAHTCLWPLASLLFLVNAIAAAVSRRIKWRGITYELKSP